MGSLSTSERGRIVEMRDESVIVRGEVSVKRYEVLRRYVDPALRAQGLAPGMLGYLCYLNRNGVWAYWFMQARVAV